MDNETIRQLMLPPRLRKKGATVLNPGDPYVILNNGTKRPMQKGDHLLIGAFVGNVGTTVRSRKGRTYHAPNGSRNYQHGGTFTTTKDPEAIAMYHMGG